MSREIRIPHSKIKDPKKITKVFEDTFKGQDLDLHVHEVERMEDDDKRGERILTVKTTKYFYSK